MRVAIVHPVFIVGGAEQLLLDMVDALQAADNSKSPDGRHEVVIYTTHVSEHVPLGRCHFQVIGDWLPRSLANGRFQTFCCGIRMLYLALFLLVTQCLWRRNDKAFDIIIADQLTWHLPLLRLLCRRKLLYYCHFPDPLLTVPRKGTIIARVLNAVYRAAMDRLDRWGLEAADEVLVNSHFTLNNFIKTYGLATARRKTHPIKLPHILYPCVRSLRNSSKSGAMASLDLSGFFAGEPVFLSLNRFERQKDLHLAIESLAACQLKCKVVVAGGFDSLSVHSSAYLDELKWLCAQLDLTYQTVLPGHQARISADVQVLFLPAVSEATKTFLLQNSRALLYTPSREHFGIGVLEAMASGLPVICMNTGGPAETVQNGKTGYHVAPDYFDISQKMERLIEGGPELHRKLGQAGRERVASDFSFAAFSKQLRRLL